MWQTRALVKKIKAMLAIAAVDGNMTAGQHPIDVEGG